MEDRVGGTADGQIHVDCIFNGFPGDDPGGDQILVDHIHDPASDLLTADDLVCEYGRDGGCAGKGHSQGLGQDLHGVGCSHGGTGTHGRAGTALRF